MAPVVSPVSLGEKKKKALRLRVQIDRLEREFAVLLTGIPLHALARNQYLLTKVQMKRISRTLHAQAQEKIATGLSREFRGDIEAVL